MIIIHQLFGLRHTAWYNTQGIAGKLLPTQKLRELSHLAFQLVFSFPMGTNLNFQTPWETSILDRNIVSVILPLRIGTQFDFAHHRNKIGFLFKI